MKSRKYEIVKQYYNSGLWNIYRVRLSVGRWITEEEYFEITGESFEEDDK